MSRLNYLTDEELALENIDQELRLLERLIAGGLQLDAIQLQTLTEYRECISQLIASPPNATVIGKADMQTVRQTSSRSMQAAEPRIEEPSIEKLRQSIWKLLDEAVG